MIEAFKITLQKLLGNDIDVVSVTMANSENGPVVTLVTFDKITGDTDKVERVGFNGVLTEELAKMTAFQLMPVYFRNRYNKRKEIRERSSVVE